MKINSFFNFLNNKLIENKNNKIIEKIYSRHFKSDDNIKIIQTHKNNVYVVYFKKQKFFRKFSIEKNGFKKIKSDHLGLKWFCKKKRLKKT